MRLASPEALRPETPSDAASDPAPRSTTPVARAVWCATRRERRDRAVADAAVAGRFTHNGVELTLGTRPDWLGGGLAEDEEWRIEWVKLYEGLDLAHAYAESGDLTYLCAWEDLVGSFCEQVPVGADSSDVTARRAQNWLYAWQRLAAAPGFPGLRRGLAERLTARLRADAAYVAGHLTAERNHRTLELYTLLLVALAFEDDAQATSALQLLAANAATDIWPDGVHRECSIDYHMVVLRSLVGAVENARRSGLPVPAPLLAAVERACTFAMHVQRPDGLTPAVSDGDVGDFRGLLADAGRLLDREDLAWVASRGAQGRPPGERLVGFDVGGYHVQRSGWGDSARAYEQERYALFDCGPVGDGGHGHYDQLSVELAGGGHSLVVDPGRYTYADGPDGWRRWFKGTAAHNTVTVDGLDQTPYRPGKPARPTSRASLLGRATVPGLDLLVGEVESPSYEARHRRSLALVDDDYWVVHDRLRAGQPHTYVARWHLPASAWDHTELVEEDGQTTATAPGVVIVVPSWCGSVRLEKGWVSTAYGIKEPAPVVVVTAAGGCDADIVTVLMPAPRSPRPQVTAAVVGEGASASIVCDGVLREVHLGLPGPSGTGRPSRSLW